MAKNKKECPLHRTSIGGSAVIEGVMMLGPREMAISVRKPDGEIETDVRPVRLKPGNWFLKLPIVRGCVGFFRSMVTSVQSLMFSAEFVDIEGEEDEPPSKFETWLEEKLGEKLKDYLIYFSVFVSLIFCVGLFILLPGFLADLLRFDAMKRTIFEAVVKLLLFAGYIVLVSQMKDIQRVFQYHGAEHKSIHCYEAGEELTPENAAKYTRLHPRCGTSFLFIVMIISVIVFLIIPSGLHWVLRALCRLLLLPVVAGLSYEIVKFAGRHDNWFTRIISAPGMAMQYLTTREPDMSQLEVAIASLKAVIPENKEEDKW